MTWFNQRFYNCDDDYLADLERHWTQHLMSLQAYLDAEVKRLNGEIWQVTRQIEDVKRELDQRKQAYYVGRGASGVEQPGFDEVVAGSSGGDCFRRVGFDQRKSDRASAVDAARVGGSQPGGRSDSRFDGGRRTRSKLARPTRQGNRR